jgi:hypothetical protein
VVILRETRARSVRARVSDVKVTLAIECHGFAPRETRGRNTRNWSMAVINAESNNFRIVEIGCEKAVCGVKRAARRRTAQTVVQRGIQHQLRVGRFRGCRIRGVPQLIAAVTGSN